MYILADLDYKTTTHTNSKYESNYGLTDRPGVSAVEVREHIFMTNSIVGPWQKDEEGTFLASMALD